MQVFMWRWVLLTVAGLVSVVAYTAIVFPEGTTRQLNILYKKVFGKEGSNSIRDGFGWGWPEAPSWIEF